MRLKHFVAFALFWSGVDQSVFLDFTQVNYSIESNYGNLTLHAGNSTHIGEVDLTFNKMVSRFTIFITIESSLGKVLHSSSFNPCNQKELATVTKMMKIIIGAKDNERIPDRLPTTWICPIRQGLTVIKSEPKLTKFSVYLPSFLAAEGNFIYKVFYKTSSAGKTAVFLKSVQRYTVKIHDD